MYLLAFNTATYVIPFTNLDFSFYELGYFFMLFPTLHKKLIVLFCYIIASSDFIEWEECFWNAFVKIAIMAKYYLLLSLRISIIDVWGSKYFSGVCSYHFGLV